MKKQDFITVKDADYLEERFKEVFATKDNIMQIKSNIIDHLDQVLKEVVSSREEQAVIGSQLTNHEERITKLENIATSTHSL